MAEYFLIPQELEHALLPSPYLSMAKMMEFPLPLQSTAITGFQPAQFFSKDADITDSDLLVRARRLAIPDAKTIYKLLECSRRRMLDGFRSVIYSHVGAVKHFPLWILTYWDAVSTLKRDAWARWRKSQQQPSSGSTPRRKSARGQRWPRTWLQSLRCFRGGFKSKGYQGPVWEEH